MPFIERSGKPRLHYKLDDFTDPWRNAPFLVLQHGFGRSSRFWYSWVPYLSRFYKIVRPDLRGLGDSSHDFDLEKDFNVKAFIEDLIAVLDTIGTDSVHYCGESLGGILGIVLAAEHPSRVRTLGLVSAPVSINLQTQKAFALGHSSWQEALNKLGSKGWAEAANTVHRFPADTEPGLLKWYAEEMGKSKTEVLIALSRLASQVNVIPYLSRIKAPVLGLYPSSGPITNREQEEALSKIPNLKVIHFATRFHMVQHISVASCATHFLHFASQFDGVPCHE